MQSIHDDKVACAAWRARGDCYYGEGKDFKLGFLDGYIGAMHGGADVCTPAVPPQRYWSPMGCRGRDCEVVTQYFDGWGHGVVAAGQDNMAGYANVPFRPRPKAYAPPAALPYDATSVPPAPDFAPTEAVAPLPELEGDAEAGEADEPAEDPADGDDPDGEDYFPPPNVPELDGPDMKDDPEVTAAPATAAPATIVPEEAVPAAGPPALPNAAWLPREPGRATVDLSAP